ncbi:site-specific tyrosine recombinase XerC [Thalassoglobus neptunius]|uniref:Site-specific tyrosine recombinase XerC n=1 Tax=Thalassoglobus neptunius TaxID=1938619 RepID=A0A5C5X588_9PLAN|nr:tyrosine-type recombinase/integrase [Thalassoglobus neptunius]TWT57908.1 site-specific tyrosine recombinase XerC [Thalassoglobus neptunius]
MKFSQPWYRKARKAWFVTLNGKQIRLGESKKEAFAKYRVLLNEPTTRQVQTASLVGIIDAFLEWVQKNRSEATYEWYRYRLQRFAQKYPDLRASDLKPYHVELWADQYKHSQTSRRNYLRSVKRCLKWAKKQGYIDGSPISDLEVPSAEHRELALDAEQFQELLTFVRSPELRDLLVVSWETGCRPQESLRVEARHVDLENQRWIFPKSESKMKRLSRVVYLSKTALEITRRLKEQHPEGKLFRNANGKPWSKDSVNCAFDAIRFRMAQAEMERRGEVISNEVIATFVPTLSPTRKVNGELVIKSEGELRSEAKRKLLAKRAVELVPRYSLYVLRHSFATRALKNGIDSMTVALLLGHKDASVLARVYQHLNQDPIHLLRQAERAAS